MRTSKVYSVSDEVFKDIIKNANSYSDCMRALGLTTRGGSSTERLKQRIKELNCSVEHFQQSNGKSANAKYDLDVEAMLRSPWDDKYQKLVHFFDSMDREVQRKEVQSQK